MFTRVITGEDLLKYLTLNVFLHTVVCLRALNERLSGRRFRCTCSGRRC